MSDIPNTSNEVEALPTDTPVEVLVSSVEAQNNAEASVAAPNPYTNPNVHASRPTILPDTTKSDDTTKRSAVALLPTNADKLDESLRNVRIFNMSYGDAGTTWASAMQSALPNAPSKIPFDDGFKQANSSWAPYVTSNANRMGASVLRMGAFGQCGGKISGERAVQRVRSLLGGGEELFFPLFTSGIWISLRPATDLEQDRLDTLILTTKERLGRQTSGLAFSNSMVYIVEHLFNFIISHITNSNVEGNDLDIIQETVLLSDLQTLAWAMAAAIYTNGYPLDIPCVNDISTCQHVSHYTLNVMQMIWHNSDRLTPNQRAYMLDRDRKRTKADILNYQKDNGQGPACQAKTIVDINDRVKLVLGQPTIQAHILDGHIWINTIVNHIDSVFPTPTDMDSPEGEMYERRRNNLMQKQANLSPLKVYAHYIREVIIVEDDESTRRIDDREPLLDIIDSICAIDGMTEKALTAIREYIAASTVSVVGVPRQPCPACQSNEVPDGEHPDLIGVDSVSLFFSLLRAKLRNRQQQALDTI